jgi:hypothetical protein
MIDLRETLKQTPFQLNENDSLTVARYLIEDNQVSDT